jgi:hypothetical protein
MGINYFAMIGMLEMRFVDVVVVLLFWKNHLILILCHSIFQKEKKSHESEEIYTFFFDLGTVTNLKQIKRRKKK